KRPSHYFERLTLHRAGLVLRDPLRFILAEHPHVAILLNQNDLKLWIGGKLNPVIAMSSWHELSLPPALLKAIPSGEIFQKTQFSIAAVDDYYFTTLSFARFRCAIRDLALSAITSAATSASLIVCSILSGAIPRRIRLSITCFLRSDLIAFQICLASANMPFGIFLIPAPL